MIQGTRDLPSGKAGNNMSYEVFDHLASELVDHDTTGNPTPVTAGKGTRNTVTDWMKNLKPHNASLQETFNELNPVDSAKICESHKFYNAYKSRLSLDVFIFNFIRWYAIVQEGEVQFNLIFVNLRFFPLVIRMFLILITFCTSGNSSCVSNLDYSS